MYNYVTKEIFTVFSGVSWKFKHNQGQTMQCSKKLQKQNKTKKTLLALWSMFDVQLKWTMFFGQTFGHNAQCHVWCWRGNDLGLFWSHSIWEPCSQWVTHEVLCILESDVSVQSLAKIRLSNRTTIASTSGNLQQKDWKNGNGPDQCCSGTLKEVCMNKCPQSSMNSSSVV